MSSRIDQRIVEMSFENHKFEKGINQSKGSLNEFAGALKNMGEGKDFRGLENSVQSMSSSFSMLEQIGIGALRKIGEAAVTAGASLIKSLSVDQLSAGLSKYQQKIEAVQTMVSAGYNLEEVEKSMEQLMWFSDETSYSFADMAGNMSKFIASGVDLKTAERSMQGIATWAAHSGKNSQAASIAMFNLSQAISMGYVDTLNWRSVMNQNMNTVMFKEVAIGVAEATGAIKKGQVTIQNFDAGLKSKWFTTDVLTKTLDQYSMYAEKVKEVQDEMGMSTAAQAMGYMDRHAEQYSDVINLIGNAAFKASQESKSFMDSINATMDAVSTGWMETYEIIFGTLYEAKKNFTALTEILWTVFAASAGVRNDMLRLIKDGGGIKQLFQTIKNVAIVLLKPLLAISKAFDQFFPPKTSQQWLGIINALESITRGMIISEETANKIQRTFAGFFAVVDIGWQVVKFLGQSMFELIRTLLPVGGTFLDTTASLGDFLVGLNSIIKQSRFFEYALLGVRIAAIVVSDVISGVIGQIRSFVRALIDTDKPMLLIGNTLKNMFSGVLGSMKTVTSWITGKFSKGLSGLHKFLTNTFKFDSDGVFGGFLEILKNFLTFLSGEGSAGISTFGDALGKLDFSRIATFITGGILLLFINQLSNLTKSMATLLTTTNTFVTKFSKKLFGTTTKIKDLAFTFGILAASLYVLSKIPWNELIRGLVGMGGALVLFVGAYAAIQYITVASSKAMNGLDVVKSSFGLIQLAAGVAIMAIAINKIAKIDSNRLVGAVAVMGTLMVFLTAYQLATALIGKIPGTQVANVKIAGMALGILSLVGAVSLLSLLSPKKLMNGLGNLAAAVLVIAGIQALFGLVSRVSGGKKMATNMLAITGGLLGLIILMKILSIMDPHTLNRSIGSVLLLGGVLAAIQAMFGIAGRLGGGVKFKTQMLAIQMGMVSMIALIAILGMMDPTKVQNGIKTIAKMALIIGALEILTALSARIGAGNKLQKILGAVSLTMLAFTGLIAILSIFKQETIDRGLITITKMFAIIVAFEAVSALASRLGGNAQGLLSIIGMIATILAVTASLLLLSMIDQEALRQASISLGIAVVAIGVMAAGVGLFTKALSLLSTSMGGAPVLLKNLIPGFAVLAVVVLSTMAFIAALNLMLPLIEAISWSSLGKFAVGLGMISAMVVGFSLLASNPLLVGGAAGIVGLIPGFAGMAAAILATVGLFAMIGLVAPILDSLSWDSFGKFILGLGMISLMAVGMALLGPALAVIGPLFVPVLGGVLVAIAGLALVVVAFAGLAALMEALFSGKSDFLINGIDKLVLVGEGMGRFVGAIAGGFSSELMIGYGEGLAGFANAVSGISPKAFDGVESLAKAMLMLTGAALLDGLSRILNFGQNPGEVFGKQMGGLVSAFKDISVEDAINATAVIEALKPMAENIVILSKAAEQIPNSGGFAGLFAGENDIDAFGIQLQKFIEAFRPVTLSATEHSTEILAALEPMTENLITISKAVDKIPNSGGLAGMFVGNNDIDTFGVKLIAFIDGLAPVTLAATTHANSILEHLVPMAESLTAFSTMAQGIPNSGGIASWFTGSNDIQKFGKKIGEFVTALIQVDAGNISLAASNLKTVASEMLPGLKKIAEMSSSLQEGSVNNLVTFATKLKEFVKILKGIDVSVVAPALKALEDISTAFSSIGSEVMVNATASFDKNKAPFQASITSLLTDSIAIVDKKKRPMETSFNGVFSGALSTTQGYVSKFKTTGMNIVAGLKSGIDAGIPSARLAINNMSTKIINDTNKKFRIASPSKVFTEIGNWLPVSLGKGIDNGSKLAVSAGVNMAESVEEAVRNTTGVHSDTPIWKKMGWHLPDSFQKGIQSGKKSVVKAASSMGIDTSKATLKGLKDTISGGEGGITSGITALLDLLSGNGEIANAAAEAGNNIGGGIADNTRGALSDSKTGLGGSKTKAVVKSELEKLQSVLDDGKYYGQLSLEEELKAYEAIRLVKGQSAEDYKKIDRETYRLTKEIYEAQVLYIEEVTKTETEAAAKREELHSDYLDNVFKANSEATKKLDDLEKKYDQNRNSANEAARKRIEQEDKRYYKSYNTILENADKERQKTREQYADKQKSVNAKLLSDIEAQNKAYEDAVKSRASAIYSSYGLFATVEEDADVDGEVLLKNLRDQGAALSEWSQSLDALSGRGVGDALIEELQKMGPASKAEIKALMQLSDGQLDEYVTLFQGKFAFARVKAETELEGLKASTSQNIKDLNIQTAIDLQDLEYEFRNSMSNINSKMATDLSELKSEYNTVMTEISSELTTKLNELKTSFNESSKEINDDTAKKLANLKTEYDKTLASINTEVDKKLKDLKAAFSTTMKDVNSLSTDEFKKLIAENKTKLTQLDTDTKALLSTVEKTFDQSGDRMVSGYSSDMQQLDGKANNALNTLQRTVSSKLNSIIPDFRNAGYDAAEGFADGITRGTSMAISAARSLAESAVFAARRALDERSPSKVFEGIGNFVSLGFANGISNYAYQAENASEGMANGSIIAITNALANLEDEMDLDSFEPVITPVLDLSNIRNSGLEKLLGGDVNLAFGSSKMARETIQNGSKGDEVTTIINQFNLNGLAVRNDLDIDLIASKLYQKQQSAQRGRGMRVIPVGR